MPDLDQFKDQAKSAASTAKDKTEDAVKGLKAKMDRDGDGDADFDDVKTMAKEATDKVKGLFHKK
jgi:hypothetical protein